MSLRQAFCVSVVVACLLLLSLSPRSVDGLRILSPVNLQRNYSTPEFSTLVSPRPASGPLLIYNQAQTLEDLRDKIVLLQANLTGPRPLAGIRNEIAFNIVAAYGPLAIVYTNPLVVDGGASETLIFHPDLWRNLSIPVVEIGFRASAEIVDLVEKNNSLIVAVDIGDFNIWRSVRQGPGHAIFQVIFALWAAACCVFSVVKLIGFIRAHGLTLNIAQICLFIELAANMFRLIYLSLDPVYAGRVFLAHQAHMMITISMPFTIMTTLLITLYWLELLTQNRVRVPTFLSSLKWPFLGVSLLMLALELATSISRALSLGQIGTLTTVSGALYAVILGSTTLLFFIVGGRTLRQLRAGEKISSSATAASKRILSKTTKLIMASGIFSILWIIGTIFAIIRQVFWDYRGYYVTWSMIFSGLLGISLTQVLSFTPPPLTSTSTRGSGAATTGTAQSMGTKSGARSGASASAGKSSTATQEYDEEEGEASDFYSDDDDDDDASDTGSSSQS